jgi:biotin operon repressor
MPELLLPRLKREIEARLAELRPLVAEAERLQAAKQALLAEAAAGQAARPRPPRRATPSRNGVLAELRDGAHSASAPSAAGVRVARSNGGTGEQDEAGRAERGTNQAAILAIVEERPGVSVAEIAAVTKIARPTVATTVSKLKREGVLADEAGGVKLASRQPVTLSQIAAATAPTA